MAPRACAAPVTAEELRIAGLVPLSTVDWPDRLVATVFCQGCPWRCVYCHNQAILDPRVPGTVAFAQLEELLGRRRGLLDGVVFSGGEATMQHALVPAVRRVRRLGFAVGLHAGGAYPSRLRTLLGVDADGKHLGPALVDWVGLDVKAGADGYVATVGVAGAARRAAQSLSILVDSGIDHELRMTVTPALLGQIPQVVEQIAAAGGDHLVLQVARPDGAPAGFAQSLPPPEQWSAQVAEAASSAQGFGQRVGVEVRWR